MAKENKKDKEETELPSCRMKCVSGVSVTYYNIKHKITHKILILTFKTGDYEIKSTKINSLA